MKLRTRAHSLPRPNGSSPAAAAGGFSMIELVVVVGLIVVMAAVGLPNFIGYLRQAKVRGAMQELAGEIQAARNKAIIRNTNAGVAFAVMDSDTYRFFIADNTLANPATLGPIHQLPGGVTFVPGALPGFAFNRLGAACQIGQPGCVMDNVPSQATLCPNPGDLKVCTDNVSGTYVGVDANGAFVVELIENTTQLRRRVEIAPSGRVVTQR